MKRETGKRVEKAMVYDESGASWGKKWLLTARDIQFCLKAGIYMADINHADRDRSPDVTVDWFTYFLL